MISGSGLAAGKVTCDRFYESVIAAIEMLNGASYDESRSVTLTSHK